MVNRSVQRFFHNFNCSLKLLRKQGSYRRFVYSVLNQYQSQWSKAEKSDDLKEAVELPVRPKLDKKLGNDKCSSDDDDLSHNPWRLELDWFTKALEPGLQLCRWALSSPGKDAGKSPPSGRSIAEIIASIQRSKVGIQDWRLSDFTMGLFLIYLRQASAEPAEDVKGVQISSESIVQDLIYHTELAKGAYKDSATGLARNSMLRESNVLKFVKYSSVMRPGYYIGIDTRKKLIIFGIRGTHTVYDLITDIISSSDGEVTFEGYSTHFGTAEAARWFLHHEMGTIRNCIEKHEGFRLRLVGHSLGGATAALLAIMLHKRSSKELGFSPDIISAVGYATPPCVSRELAESCSDYVTTVVMQDDIIPRLSAASLTRLRNEILQTDWKTVLEKEDWKSVTDLVTNAKQVVSSLQDAVQKVADYTNFNSKTNSPAVSTSKSEAETSAINEQKAASSATPKELFVPGTFYCLKRTQVSDGSGGTTGREAFTLWKREPGEHYQRIVLSSNMISDHKCDSHYYALRDVLKALPAPHYDDGIFG